jgi:hypothetical protein
MAYFVRIKGKAFGPFDESQLLEMKSKGKIIKATEISENGKDDWRPAETFSFLYESAQVTQPPPTEQAIWFYSLNGKEGYGSVTGTAIEQMLQSGQLNSNSYVWQQGQNARFIKNEPRFSGGGGSTSPASVDYNTGNVSNVENTANIDGEITGSREQVDTGQILRSIADSLGWLMLLKITWLSVGVVLQGLCILVGGGWWLAHLLRTEQTYTFVVALVLLVLASGLYALQFKAFLYFWKYHKELQQTVTSGKASDLTQACQSQHLFWKWLGIDAIAHLALIPLAGIAIALMIAFR